MFNISGSEIVIIMLLALVVLGPDKLPDFMRRAGRTWAELRKLSSGFQDEVRKGFEEPVREVRETATAVSKAATFDAKVDTTSTKKAADTAAARRKTRQALPTRAARGTDTDAGTDTGDDIDTGDGTADEMRPAPEGEADVGANGDPADVGADGEPADVGADGDAADATR